MAPYGFLLRKVTAKGDLDVDLTRLWAYDPFLKALRQALEECCELPPALAKDYGTHSMRSGPVTETVKAGVPLHLIKAQAGVTGASWIDRYDRPPRPAWRLLAPWACELAATTRLGRRRPPPHGYKYAGRDQV